MKKKIYIIGTVGVPACYGGFESLVENLLDYTSEDVQYTVSGRFSRELLLLIFRISGAFHAE